MAKARINTSYMDLPEHRRSKSVGASHKSNDAWSFVKQDRHLCSNNKVLSLALQLDMRRVCAIGILVTVWENVANDTACQYGEITSIPPMVLESWVEWQGERGALYKALVEMNFIEIDADGTRWIHDWWDFAGDYLKQRDDKRFQMRETRERDKEAKKQRKIKRKRKKALCPEHSGNVAGTPLDLDLSLPPSVIDHVRGKDQGEAPELAEAAEQRSASLASPPPPIPLDRDRAHELPAVAPASPEPQDDAEFVEVVAEHAPPQPERPVAASTPPTQALVPVAAVATTAPPPDVHAPMSWQQAHSFLTGALQIRASVCPGAPQLQRLRDICEKDPVSQHDMRAAMGTVSEWAEQEGVERISVKAFLTCLAGQMRKKKIAAEQPNVAMGLSPDAGHGNNTNRLTYREEAAVRVMTQGHQLLGAVRPIKHRRKA